MPAGFEVFNALGNLSLSITDRVATVVGISLITGYNGSLSNSVPGNATPFAFVLPLSTLVNPSHCYPVLTAVGATVVWQYSTPIRAPAVNIHSYIIYGYY